MGSKDFSSAYPLSSISLGVGSCDNASGCLEVEVENAFDIIGLGGGRFDIDRI